MESSSLTLCCVGLDLVLARAAQVRHKRQVNVETVVPPQIRTQLADCLQKGQAFDVAHCAADFYNRHVRRILAFGQRKHGFLDLVGDVRNYLDSGAQIVAVTLFGNDLIINGARGCVVFSRHGHVKVTLVMAQVEIRLGARRRSRKPRRAGRGSWCPGQR